MNKITAPPQKHGPDIAFALLVALALFLGACSGTRQKPPIRSLYYWSTTFVNDSLKRQFYKAHNVQKLYIRYFDVVKKPNQEPLPNATIDFKDSVPQGIEVIPTVFITNECMRQPPQFAEQLWQRIRQMNETHGVKNVKEIQIDCDWSKQTQDVYFQFLRRLHQLLAKAGLKLSVTIRLHQLGMQAPPVDKGTLMLYNTGDFRQLTNPKPILDPEVVRQYVGGLRSYSLPLNAAYPLFRIRALFRSGKFVGIIHTKDEYPVLPTDSIAVRETTLADLQSVQQLINKHRPDVHNEIILYDINNRNLTKYSSNDYEKIYNP